ncbi:hypothetical protein BH11PSE4_BH11PSE4_26840 [soil metagenome]
MVVAVALEGGRAFRWNLSANVGPGQPNLGDDVDFVRFGYFCMKINPVSRKSPELQAALNKLRPAGGYDTDLAEVIRIHQKDRGGKQDGIVSVERATNANRETYDGAHVWIVAVLNNNMLDVTNDVYPRIDKHPSSGVMLMAAVKRVMTNSSV